MALSAGSMSVMVATTLARPEAANLASNKMASNPTAVPDVRHAA